MLLESLKSNLTCEAGCGLRFHGRIMVGSAPLGNDVSAVFRLGGHFAWQAQYLVSLEGDIGCSAHCK